MVRCAYVVKTCFERCYTTSWGPGAIINFIQGGQSPECLLQLSRQPPKPPSQKKTGCADIMRSMREGKDMQHRQAGVCEKARHVTRYSRHLVPSTWDMRESCCVHHDFGFRMFVSLSTVCDLCAMICRSCDKTLLKQR